MSAEILAEVVNEAMELLGLPPGSTDEQFLDAIRAARQRGRAEALPIAFADCEALVSAGLEALAVSELSQANSCVGGTQEEWHRARAGALREAALAVSLGQFRTVECNEKAIVAAHREAAGFNSSKAGGEARSRALSPERRREIAAAGGKGKKAFGKLSPAQRRFLARAQAENGTFYLADEDAATPQRASGWWRTARSLARRGAVEKVSGVNAYKLTDAARARGAAKKGE